LRFSFWDTMYFVSGYHNKIQSRSVHFQLQNLLRGKTQSTQIGRVHAYLGFAPPRGVALMPATTKAPVGVDLAGDRGWIRQPQPQWRPRGHRDREIVS